MVHLIKTIPRQDSSPDSISPIYINNFNVKLNILITSTPPLMLTLMPGIQSVPQDQKSVTFSHSVISHNQLLQNSKITAYIFLTFRNHVKIFLSQNILQNILNVVYRTTLSIRTAGLTNSEDTDQTAPWGAVWSGSLLFVILSAWFTQWYCKENPNCSVLGYFQYLFQVF